MTTWRLDDQRLQAEDTLLSMCSDFSATYMAVSTLEHIVQDVPDTVTADTISALAVTLNRAVHKAQRQSFFLYRKAANALTDVVINDFPGPLGDAALGILKQIVTGHSGPVHRAAAEALGRLPVGIMPLELPPFPKIQSQGTTVDHLPQISWKQLDHAWNLPEGNPAWAGRSLKIEGPEDVVVIKFARADDRPDDLATETGWMRRLGDLAPSFPHRFDVPEALAVDGSDLFRIARLPVEPPEGEELHPELFAIAYRAGRDYFAYPNETSGGQLPPPDDIVEIIGRNAWLLGRLTAHGIIHTAPIPLFHNRSQRHRRDDAGVYIWSKAGRLDQWLASSRYPNLAKSGLRDFEHLEIFSGKTRDLYEQIGNHILSLMLVAGSYFRGRDTRRIGFDRSGNPVDARELFDPGLFTRLIEAIFSGYHEGFTGLPFQQDIPVDTARFVDRLIDEMGVDRHMEELLRVTDQEAMSDEMFREFLVSRGYSRAEADRMERGARDISTWTGPHLGGFNSQISLPELIRFTAAAAAFCISEKFTASDRQAEAA